MKTYNQVTEQFNRINCLASQAEQLEGEVYVELSWEDWAYLVTELDHYPRVVACGENGYVVVSDGLTQPHNRFYFRSAYTGKRTFYDRAECWYSAYLKVLAD